MAKRSPYELANGAQRTRKKKRCESSSDCEAEANAAWLDSVLHPSPQNVSPEEQTQHAEVAARVQPAIEKRPVQTQVGVEGACVLSVMQTMFIVWW
jgi:hypothetical protein